MIARPRGVVRPGFVWPGVDKPSDTCRGRRVRRINSVLGESAVSVGPAAKRILNSSMAAANARAAEMNQPSIAFRIGAPCSTFGSMSNPAIWSNAPRLALRVFVTAAVSLSSIGASRRYSSVAYSWSRLLAQTRARCSVNSSLREKLGTQRSRYGFGVAKSRASFARTKQSHQRVLPTRRPDKGALRKDAIRSLYLKAPKRQVRTYSPRKVAQR